MRPETGTRPQRNSDTTRLPFPSGGSAGIHHLATLAKSKVAIAATAVTLAAGGGVGAKGRRHRKPNPINWGHRVKEEVVTCKQDLPAGQHGIGRCGSDFAKRHGLQQRQEHSKTGSHPTGRPKSSRKPHPMGPHKVRPYTP